MFPLLILHWDVNDFAPSECAAKLTSVKKAGLKRKETLVSNVQQCVDDYERMFVFSFENMRTAPFKELRERWSDSRFFLGKNKVMQIALGKTAKDAYRPKLEKVARVLSGQVGLLFTNRSKDEVLSFFAGFRTLDYARYGAKATERFEVKAGILEMAFTMAEQLRSLGMPVELDNGKVRLTRDYVVCEKGDILSTEQSHLLQHFAKPMAYFKLNIIAEWSRDDEEFTMLDSSVKIGADGQMDAESDSDDEEAAGGGGGDE